MKALTELSNSYMKEQTEYFQDQIDEIRNSVDGQSRIARQTVNEVSKRKSTSRAKLNACPPGRMNTLLKRTFQESS